MIIIYVKESISQAFYRVQLQKKSYTIELQVKCPTHILRFLRDEGTKKGVEEPNIMDVKDVLVNPFIRYNYRIIHMFHNCM